MWTSLRKLLVGAARWIGRWGLSILALLLVVGCFFWSGLFLQFPILSQLWANHLDQVQGKAELLAPAQWRPGAGELSPDSRRMVLGWIRAGEEELFVWELATGERKPLKVSITTMRWLNPDQFAILDASDKYYIGDARDGSIRPVTQVQTITRNPPSMLKQVLAQWQAADQIYVLEVFSLAGYTILTHEQGQYYIYRMDVPDQQVKMLLATLPYIEVPIYGWHSSTGSQEHPQWVSPDGRLYATEKGSGGDVRVQIYTQAGELIAEAYKGGWQPYVLGWAHDNSGIYVQWEITGSAAAVVVPYRPLFKLSPLTPEEERWLLAQRVGLGVGIVGLLVGARWWWRRRRSPESS